MVRCPGQDERFWKPADVFEVQCAQCGTSVEFFKDEPKLKCRNCGSIVVNPKINLGCAQWCQYAGQCVGVSAARGTAFLQDSLIDEMQSVFAGDERRIKHALAVLDYAEQIQQAEGADPLVVKAVAILHDIGIAEAERQYGSASARYQEMLGPPVAEAILKKYRLPAETIEHICRIVGSHHSGRDIDTIEFKCVWDADWLVNIPEVFEGKQKSELLQVIERTFRTGKGREIASRLFLKSEDT